MAPEAGTRITNQAEAFGFLPDIARSIDLLSNQVVVTVLSDIDIDLDPDRSVFLTPGATAAFNHTLTNTGNERTTYTLTFANLVGDDYDFRSLGLVLDSNGNALIDSGEPLLGQGYEITLDPGESIDFILRGLVPNDLVGGESGSARFTATVDGSTLIDEVTDIASIGQSETQLLKGVDRTVAEPGELVNFTLTAINGNFDLEPINATIDGQIEVRIVIRDEIPRNTVFSQFNSSIGTEPVYHLHDFASDHEYTLTPPDDLSEVEAVAFVLTQLEANQAIDVGFQVLVSANASGDFTNQGFLYHQPSGQPLVTVPSNPVLVQVPVSCPDILIYPDETFTLPTEVVPLGTPLFIEVNAPFLNTFPNLRDELEAEVSSAQTSDRITVTFIETAPNSGIFRRKLGGGVTSLGVTTEDNLVANLNDDVLQTAPRDVITAIIRNGCFDAVTQIQILIDPAGIIFDSRTGERIAGATVTLIDVTGAGNGGNAGGEAIVFKADGVTPSPSTVVTGTDGFFEFPRVAASEYRIDVIPPEDYAFPSVVPEPLLPSIVNPVSVPRILEPVGADASGSYNGVFPVNQQTGAVFLDIPLDTSAPASYELEKIVNRSEVEIGDSVQYTLTLTNSSGARLPGTYIDDVLPDGVSYIAGTTRINSETAPDPEGDLGPELQFQLGSIATNEVVEVSYRARVGFGADQGDGVNRARATSLGPPVTRSNLALAAIEIDQGVFTDRGIIFGKVFVDLNDNRIHDSFEDKETGEFIEEPVVPGVRIFLEDGTYAITDIEGKYSIYGQRAITHVVKLDTYTLPRGAKLGVIDNRNANDPDSRFADLRKGELHKANFRIIEPSSDLLAAVDARRAQDSIFTAEVDRVLEENFTFQDRVENTDPTNGPASGIVGGDMGGAGNFFSPLLPEDTLNAGNSNLPERPVAQVPHVSLERELNRFDSAMLGFIDLKDGDTLPMAQTRLRVLAPIGSTLKVFVNEREVPAHRRGKLVEDAARGLMGVEYVAVRLDAGQNQIKVLQFDPFGNLRGEEEITVIAPDELAQISISFSDPEPPADGTTPVSVFVSLTDVNGIPVSARTPLTLETSAGRWDLVDANPNEEGLQVFLTGGQGEFRMLPPGEPSNAKVTVSSGVLESSEYLPFLPDLRPLIASGILQGRINLSGKSGQGISPVLGNHGFEEELRSLSSLGDDEDPEGRAAFYLKGKMKGEWLLTTAYDSDKDRDDDLFRDIEPDEYYPVYGDSSVRGFDAQSSGNLYVRLDHKRSFLLYGDFHTRSRHEARDFGNYNRTLNGFQGHFEDNRTSANVFASRGNAQQVVLEIAANGTSGPYNFSAANGLINSEQIEIVTRDRNQLSTIIDVEPKTRFVDYEFEPFTGRVLFRRPVSSLDLNLNPRFIRITYEVEQGGPEFWTYGVDGQRKLNEYIEVGGSYAFDENPLNEYTLYSGNTTVKLPFDSYFIAEVAQSDEMESGVGAASRAEVRHVSEKTDARVFYAKTESEFVNPSATLTPGRVESGAEVTHRIAPGLRVNALAVHTEDSISESSREGVRADVIKRFANDVELSVGGRISRESGTAINPSLPSGSVTEDGASNDVKSIRGKLSVPVPYLADMRVSAELEQSVDDSSSNRVGLGAEYQVSSKTRLYGVHEFGDTYGGDFELTANRENNRTLFGIETEYMRDGQFFNEYRVRDAIDGEQAEASTGLRNQWHVADGLRLNSSFERVSPLSGTSTNKSTAITGAVEYTRPADWKSTARMEWRTTPDQDSFLNTLGYARKLNLDWTFLGKTLLHHQDNQREGTDDLTQGRLQLGFAWREVEKDVWNSLYLYEYKFEDGVSSADALGTRRAVHIFSNNLNYQPNEDWIWMNRLAAKFVDERQDFFADRFAAYQVNGRLLRLFGTRWDLGLNYAVRWEDSSDEFNYGLGPEAGIWLMNQLRCGVGYNFWGYIDRDFNTSRETESGFFITISLKFDEDNLRFGRKGEGRE